MDHVSDKFAQSISRNGAKIAACALVHCNPEHADF